MAIERWDPFRDAISLRDAMNSLFQESFVRPSGLAAQDGLLALPLDVSETEDGFVVKASLPGVKPARPGGKSAGAASGNAASAHAASGKAASGAASAARPTGKRSR